MIEPQRRRALPTLILSMTLAAVALLPSAARAEDVPTRVRVLKATRGTPTRLDPRLEDVKKQISSLAWQRWEVVSDATVGLKQSESTFVDLPDGSRAALSVVEVRGKIVTIEVSIAQKNTQTRVTIERGQRIVHQVAKEKKGLALFIVVTPWP